MITGKDVQTLLNRGVEYKKECVNLIKDILEQFIADDETHAVLFDAHLGRAPQFVAHNLYFDDGVDVYITSMWLDGNGDIRVGLIDFDGADYAYGILLETAGQVDYEDILSWLQNQL